MIDVRPDSLDCIKKILASRVPDAEVLAFGSRVSGTTQDYSDLDLAIVAEDRLPLRILAHLREDFDESELSFRIDVLDWQAISEEFRNVIKQQYEVIQKPTHSRRIR